MDSHTFNNLISSLKKGDFDDDKADAIKTTVQAARGGARNLDLGGLRLTKF
jgi:hypothetical protein